MTSLRAAFGGLLTDFSLSHSMCTKCTMQRTCWQVLSLFALLLDSGCATSNKIDALESGLRRQEAVIGDLNSNLEKTRSQLVAARSETNSLRSQLQKRGQKAILPEQASVLFGATGIKFNTLLTGGLDRDGSPGHERLNVVLTPHDADEEAVKLPGRLELQALDLSRSEDQRVVGRWEFGVDEFRHHWDHTWFASGYHFDLAWPQTPESTELLLYAKLTTPDNRTFDTSTTIHIQPAAGSQPTRSSSSNGLTSKSTNEPIKPAAFHRFPTNNETISIEERPLETVLPRIRPDVDIEQTKEPSSGAEFRQISTDSDTGPSEEQPSSETAAAREEWPPIRTSDVWTDATIPRFR